MEKLKLKFHLEHIDKTMEYKFNTDKTTIVWAPWGPKMTFKGDDRLIIEDLNPETKMVWGMTRKELFRLGLSCIMKAIRW